MSPGDGFRSRAPEADNLPPRQSVTPGPRDSGAPTQKPTGISEWQRADLESRSRQLRNLVDDIERYGEDAALDLYPWGRPGRGLPGWAVPMSVAEWRAALPVLFARLPAELAAQLAVNVAPPGIPTDRRLESVRAAAEGRAEP